jgi:Secretion system C-terminal sorting domain
MYIWNSKNQYTMKKQLLLVIVTLFFYSINGYSQAGFTCNQAISIASLPYQTSDNTINYGDLYDVSQPQGCGVTSGNYMTGNDVFYSYSPVNNEVLNIRMSPNATWSGIFVYDGCNNVGISCVAGIGNSGSTLREIPQLSVLAGHTYIFALSTYATPQTFGYTLQIQNAGDCLYPSQLVASNISNSSVSLTWANLSNSYSWEVAVVPSGTMPTVGVQTNSNTNFNVSGLSNVTSYKAFVRSDCGNGTFSNWSTPVSFTTHAVSLTTPVCGGVFTDNGGLVANYQNNTDSTVTIYPSITGELVTVTFSSFDVETNYDGLYVFDGNSILAPQITSSNPSAGIPGGVAGAFWGNTIPGPFTSTSPDGSLTFRFISDNSLNKLGWNASVECEQAPTCLKPSLVQVTPSSYTDAIVSWLSNGASQWEVLVLTSDLPNPTASSIGIITNSNPYLATNLINGQSYKVFVRSICSPNDISKWSVIETFTMPNCQTPTNVIAIDIMTYQADIIWSNPSSSLWEVLVVVSGTAPPTNSTSGILVSSSTYLANGLTASTSYDCYIRSVCNFNDFSQWTNVTTFSTGVASIPIIPNTSNFTPTELVGFVLAVNPCIQISNVTSSTGTNFGSVNGIGYFTNSNPNFPISSGIMLSTGNVMSAAGPNTNNLSEGGTTSTGSDNWVGDADLESIILNETGESMSSRNATKLEFDFTTLNEFMSFNFVFASEEYGVFQCNYSDAFAFLLTDLTTGETTNLAVVPGTSSPVSVVTIRNEANNSSCTSVNPAFFGAMNNNFNSATNYNGQTALMTASSVLIPNNPYHIKLVVADRLDTAFDSTVFLEAGGFTSGPPQCTDKIQLVAFVDSNNNGIKETTENDFNYGSFVLEKNNTGVQNFIASPIGTYVLFDNNPLNTYDFNYQINPEYAPYYTTPITNFNDVNIPVGSMTQTIYFPMTLAVGYNDVTITVVPSSSPRPGISYTNKIVYKNLGVNATSGTINFIKDSNTTITSCTQTGIINNPTGFVFNFSNLQPYETRTFDITMQTPPIPTVNIGDLLVNSATITAPANDINLVNNSFINSQIVVASYDPNDKMEAHGNKILFSSFTANDYLTYTIRFQNTGTANAINVRLEDLLNAKYDSQSIRMISSSHAYVLERINNKLKWRFDYINLVSSAQDFNLSQGYVTFKIKLKPGFAVGDIIPNTANIYFDTNPPIATNTFTTQFTSTLANANFDSSNFMIFPNPANNVIQINLQNTNETLESIQINDILGKSILKISTISSKQQSIDVSNLSKGVYFVEIITESKLKQTKKLIIE